LFYSWLSLIVRDEIDGQLLQYTRSVNETIARHPDNLVALMAAIETVIASSAADWRLAVELYDQDGRFILQRDILAPFDRPLSTKVAAERIEQGVYEVIRDGPYPYFVLVEKHLKGFMRVAIYGGPSLRELETLRYVLMVMSVVGMILTGGVGWWLARQSLRPISEIIGTVDRVSGLGSKELLLESGSGDELDVLARALNAMIQRLRENSDRMRSFAAQAAHELMTPLGIARTRIEVTLSEESDSEACRQGLVTALSDIESLTESVNGVLEIARSGAGLDPRLLERVDLAALLRDLSDFYRVFAEDQGVHFETTSPVTTTVIGDPIWLHRLFSNLLDNAIKFSGSGGSVTLNLSQREDEVVVVIHDTGVGIVEKERDLIFDRFYRGGDQREPGNGLGLALCMEIVRAHAGSIEYESPAEGGSIFRVKLPTDPTVRNYVRA